MLESVNTLTDDFGSDVGLKVHETFIEKATRIMGMVRYLSGRRAA